MIASWIAKLRFVGLLVLVLVPVIASAQQASGIAGVVRDTSGGVLPGVTVEAASPALIEKVRTVVTDGEGRYNIVDLRPGSYAVTFTLAGFNTFKRDGIALTAGFTATVNADMPVGALEETITVTGAAPLVDTQNVRQQKVVSDELLASLPTGSKGLMGISTLIPGLSSGSNEGGGGSSGIYGANRLQGATMHGKGSAKQNYDGMATFNLAGTGNTTYIMNAATVVETTFETGGISAESDSSGISVNMIPKEGGNGFSFGVDGTYANQHLQASNLTDELKARGVTRPSKLLHSYDTNVTVGGPLRRDRLWFFAATRFTGTKNEAPDLFYNTTQGTPFYTPGGPAPFEDWLKSQASRVTWQVSPRNKINTFADLQNYQTRGTGTFTAPEAGTCWRMFPVGLYQGSWTSPVTSKLLLEAAGGMTDGRFPCTRENVTQTFGFVVKPTDVAITESSTGFIYNASNIYSPVNDQYRYAQRFAASYVTGSHSYKAGLQLQEHVKDVLSEVNSDVRYTFNKGVPTKVTQFATPYLQKSRTKAELGVFVQDQWAIKRLTLNYGLRFDYYNGYVPAQHVDAGQFVGARDFEPVYGVPEWTDLSPRVGGSYNLFGDGRTALKASIGRYSGKLGVNVAEANNPIVTSVNSASRTWTDADKDFVPDCNLKNFAANGECAALDNVNFGKVNPKAVTYADELIRGFGNRDYLWDMTVEVQHEVRPGVSVLGGYYRNWTRHFGSLESGWPTGVTDNSAAVPADYTTYCITAPVDPNLPGGGGYPVCGLYDISLVKFGQGTDTVTRASNYGDGKSRSSQFVTGSINSRIGRKLEMGASVDTGQSVQNDCYVVDSPQQLLNCKVVTPLSAQTQIKVHGVYQLPGAFVVSGILQNVSGINYRADYTASNAEVKPSLGRNLASCGTKATCTASVTVPLIAPQTQFEPRRTVLDLRMSKVFTVGRKTRLRANLDIYNLMNAGHILAINSAYGQDWQKPSGRAGGIMPARLVQVGGQLTF